jgi:hypothetical protein
VTRAAVRSAAQSFFQGLDIPTVGTVFASRAYVHGEDYEQNAALQYSESVNGSGAVLVVNIPSEKRQRRADTGRGGVNDSCIYRIALEVYLANSAGAPVDAQTDYDAIIDELFLQIRGNPNLGNPIAVWSAGEFNYGVEHEQSEPWTEEDGTTVFITGVVRFEAWEWDAGPAGSV